MKVHGVIRRSVRSVVFASAFLLALSAFAPRSAEAVPPVLRPATGSMYATFGIGGAFTISGDVLGVGFPSQFRMEQAFGWHFLGGASGPAVALHLGENFGGVTVLGIDVSVFAFQMQGRFLWDFQPVANLGLYIAPYFGMGFSVASAGDPCDQYSNDCSEGAFNMGFGGEVRLALGGMGLVFFRPISFDFNFGEETIIRYELMLGGGLYFF